MVMEALGSFGDRIQIGRMNGLGIGKTLGDSTGWQRI
jgi:hypothetical protein